MIGYDLFHSFLGNPPADKAPQQKMLIAMLNRTTAARGKHMFCSSHRFCMRIEHGRIYCYGSATKCLWPTPPHSLGDCLKDADCTRKYTTTSPKYTDGTGPDNQCPHATMWRQEACHQTGLGTRGYHGELITETLRREFEAIGQEYLGHSGKKWRSHCTMHYTCCADFVLESLCCLTDCWTAAGQWG